MRQNQVEIGKTYIAKVSNRLVSVRLKSNHPLGGWFGVNLRTGKTIRIKSAQRLRGPAPEPKGITHAHVRTRLSRSPRS